MEDLNNIDIDPSVRDSLFVYTTNADPMLVGIVASTVKGGKHGQE